MKMLLTLSLLCLLSAISPAASTIPDDCAKLVSEVMSRNSPELLILPPSNPDSEFNTFIATEIRVRVDWSRIRESLKGRRGDSTRERLDEIVHDMGAWPIRISTPYSKC